MLQSYFWVVLAPDMVRVRIGVTPREIAVVRGLEPDMRGGFDPRVVEAAVDDYGAYLIRHVKVTADERPLRGRLVHAARAALAEPSLGSVSDLPFAQYDLEYATGADPEAGPARVVFEQDVLQGLESAPGQPWDLSYVLRIKYVDGREIESGLLRNRRPFIYLTRWQGAGEAHPPPAAAAYLTHGIQHVLGGWDHLLFVTALVLASASLWRLIQVIACFTIAHSLTLACATLGLLRLDPAVVEPVIAASIVFVALENVLMPERARGRGRLVAAFAFGLFHGLGFAGGLADAMQGLPRLDLGLAIVAFSAGVELGHLAVVLPVFALLRLGRRLGRFEGASLRYGSALISACGLYYLCLTPLLRTLASEVHLK
jgi:hydrogenase/urease accessory protein HupE